MTTMDALLKELKQREVDARLLNGRVDGKALDRNYRAARLLIEEVRLGLESRLKVDSLRAELGIPSRETNPLEGVQFYGDKRGGVR
jgi:hypothetical protein